MTHKFIPIISIWSTIRLYLTAQTYIFVEILQQIVFLNEPN